MSTPISSATSAYNFTVQGQGIGSIQSLLTQLRGLMGEIDQQTASIEGELRGRMENTRHERGRLDFLRSLSAGMPTDGTHLDRSSTEGIIALMRRNGIDPGSNPEDQRMCAELGIYVDRYQGGGTSGAVEAIHMTNPAPILNRDSVNSIISNHQSTLEELTNAMQQDSSRLQGLMNRRSEFLNTISQCLNAEHSTNASIIQNIR